MFSIILAAGTGKRMRRPDRQKVCFEVGGVPTILRAIRGYDAAGVKHHVVVVGQHPDQVIAAVGRSVPNVTFAYQPEPLGTGNAAKCGARVLRDAGYDGAVLVVAGDKIVDPAVVRKLRDGFQEGNLDLAILTGEKQHNPTSGRVLLSPEGEPEAIVEVSEIKLSRVVQDVDALLRGAGEMVACERVLAAIHRQFPDRSKARKATDPLYGFVAGRDEVPAAEVREHLGALRRIGAVSVWRDGQSVALNPCEVEEMTERVNLSVYLFSADALHAGLDALTRDNAQREEFLTDTVLHLAAARRPGGAPRYRLASVALDTPTDVLSFNTPEELAEIDRLFRAKHDAVERVEVTAGARLMRPISEWQAIFSSRPATLSAVMQRIYGDDAGLLEAKRQEYLAALSHAERTLGAERLALIVRSPGRINLLGRHIDHRGGCVNVMAISEELLMVASPREDDELHLRNTDAETFHATEFSIGDQIARLDWGDWLACVNSPKTLDMVQNGNWDNYVKASALRLKHEVGSAPLKGADIVAHGTIPIGSGLSSSSAVVVGAAEVLITVNGLQMRSQTVVDLCGEGEWFVGTRGGKGDHAAIKLAKRGQVAQVEFFPFRVVDFVPFPEDHALVVCDSGEQAKKSEGARETFNSRVLGYVMAELIFKREFPDLAPSIHHLRDITCENLGVGLAELYQMLTSIPLCITEQEFLARYGPFSAEDNAKLADLVSTIQDRAKTYNVRGLLLYGLAECERAQRCMDLLRRGDAEGLGRLWRFSHDGDRVVRHDSEMRPVPYAADVSDARLRRLSAELMNGDPAVLHAAHLHAQPGLYACSTPGVDRIVDIAMGAEGVRGAQMAGAGLGGCVMILVQSAHRDALFDALGNAGLSVAEYRPVEGAGVIEL